ncbi:MAG: hypothetical protein Kow0099_19060 [Candidatus Abyssubacteria bacterium]
MWVVTTDAIEPGTVARVDHALSKGMTDGMLSGMAALAQFHDIGSEERAYGSRVGLMAKLAIAFCDRLMHEFKSIFPLEILMTFGAQLALVLFHEKSFVRCVRRMARRTIALAYGLVHDGSRELFPLFIVTGTAERNLRLIEAERLLALRLGVAIRTQLRFHRDMGHPSHEPFFR